MVCIFDYRIIFINKGEMMKKFLLSWLLVIIGIVLFGSIFLSVPLLISILKLPEWIASLWFFIIFTGLFAFVLIKED